METVFISGDGSLIWKVVTRKQALAVILVFVVASASLGVYYFVLRPLRPPIPLVLGDDDGMLDSWEMFYGLDMNNPDDAQEDRDGDGLTNLEEYLLDTNPILADTDGDGLKDGREVNLGTDPNNPDTDDDGLSDGEEVLTHNTNPTNPDTDGDGLDDGTEVTTVGSDPKKTDTDEDGLDDWAEVTKHKTDPLLKDTDGDGLEDGDEVNTYRTNPKDSDTDHDMLTDEEEIQHGTNPLDPDTDGDGLDDGSEPSWNVDTDGDGLINALDTDSDNDLLVDGDEIDVGANPLDSDTDDDRIIDGWDPAPVDTDADDDGLKDGDEATAWTYWYEAEELVADEGLIGDDPDARNGRAVFSLGSGIVFNYSIAVSEGRYKFFVRARAEFAEAANRSIELSVVQGGVEIVKEDPHLVTAIYRWYSTQFFNVSEGQLQIMASTNFAWVIVDRVSLVRMDSINSELTDPLDQDTDGDGILDGRESVINAYWYEAEDFAWNSSQVIDSTNASNSKHIIPLPDGRLAYISEPSYIYPNGTYVVFVRAMSGSLNLNNIMEVNIFKGGISLMPFPLQVVLVRQVLYDSTSRYVSLYEWFFTLSFTLAQDDTIAIELSALGELDNIFVDKVLLIKIDFWQDTVWWSYVENNATVGSVLHVPRGISDPMDIDTDGDGYRATEGFLSGSTGWLTDGQELYEIGTNPFDIDTDRDGDSDNIDFNPLSGDTDMDGLLDWVEISSDYDPDPVVQRGTNATNADTDGDGIKDGDEDLSLNGLLDVGETNPIDPDTDGDGIQDGTEIGFPSPDAPPPASPPIITDPLNPDTDGDGLIDGTEDSNKNGAHESLLNETRADEPDTDFDGLNDFEEVWNYTTNPNYWDSDDDWLSDGLEVHKYGTNPMLNDTDGEGLTDGLEIIRYKTNATNPDSDTDGLNDWEEVAKYGTNPLDPDTDHDGLNDNEEIINIGTDPKNPDTDGDGVNDGEEVSKGTNPLNAPPKAFIGLDREVYRNIEVQFDGSASYDSDGQIVSYAWGFGDGTTDRGVQPTHTYTQIGNFTVTLNVTDDDAESGLDTVEVAVLNQPPNADAGSDQTVFVGETVNFNGSASFDPDGTIVSYSWNFQNGATGTGVTTTHTFASPESYYVTLTVTDNDGAVNTDTVVIIVEKPKPPDLTISSEDMAFSTKDQNVILNATINNKGDLNASNVLIKVYDEGVNGRVSKLISEMRVRFILGGLNHTFTVTLPSEPIGLQIIRVEVDPNHDIQESDEGNNVARKLVQDTDGDGLSDLGENIFGSNPTNSDTDGDGLLDGPLIDPNRMEPSWNTDTDRDGLINVLDVDSDNDGVIDGADLDPLHDLLVKVEITRIKIEDPIDPVPTTHWHSYTVYIPHPHCNTHWHVIVVPHCHWTMHYHSTTIWTPHAHLNKEAEPYFKVRISDQWNSGHWVHSEVPLANDVEDYSFSDPPIFVVNVPDDDPIVDIRIEAWDRDIGPLPESILPSFDDKLDISSVSGESSLLGKCKSGCTFFTTFDLAEAAKYSPMAYAVSDSTSGIRDGSGQKDEDDAKIWFEIYMGYELSYQEQVALAEKFSPQLYFHEDEIWRPRDIRDFLDNADLKDSSDNVVDSTPTPEEIATYLSEDYYLDLDDQYHSQDSSVYGFKVYAHVFTAYKNKIVIQYWFSYLYNDWFNKHEGDWEMIQLILPDKDSLPTNVDYSWHLTVWQSFWPLSPPSWDGNHPLVFVDRGSHASSMMPVGVIYEKEDMTKYSIEILSGQGWLKFQGNWGAPGGPGSVFRYSADVSGKFPFAYMWTDPIFWRAHQTYPL